ncbi:MULTISPECIES: hypothetical protein [Acinetobacter]|mgnify:CR=1 FL=1|uniref:Uncharacterized protein n=1 Tax=Acinetobacter corruptisaponis TaxID=3045147 RepID=A0ABY8S666_9GAMM|nr:hypothetical protein [Acinetobacter sp. KCTC 92772]WHP05774.1 hypothetical protein QLH32_17500 [Acinetobacter sp. KCTC 92772]
MIKKGDQVKVDFIHQLEKNGPEIHFYGEGILDRVEDGRVYGRLDDGQPFTCMVGDVVKSVSKYNWSLIPEHVQFMATDEDGIACGWLVEPKILGDAWRHQAHFSAYFYINRRNNYLNHFRGDWRESLEQRPKEQNQ